MLTYFYFFIFYIHLTYDRRVVFCSLRGAMAQRNSFFVFYMCN